MVRKFWSVLSVRLIEDCHPFHAQFAREGHNLAINAASGDAKPSICLSGSRNTESKSNPCPSVNYVLNNPVFSISFSSIVNYEITEACLNEMAMYARAAASMKRMKRTR